MKLGFDNDKYLKMQSDHIRERINQLEISFIWNLAENSLMIFTLPGFCPALRPTVNSACCCSWPTRPRL